LHEALQQALSQEHSTCSVFCSPILLSSVYSIYAHTYLSVRYPVVISG